MKVIPLSSLELLLGFAVGAVLLVVISRPKRRFKKAGLLRGWASKNGLRLLRVEERSPPSGKQRLYRVLVRDEGGKERSGMVECVPSLGGLLGDRAKVTWDDNS
jgi:hypothetical protein